MVTNTCSNHSRWTGCVCQREPHGLVGLCRHEDSAGHVTTWQGVPPGEPARTRRADWDAHDANERAKRRDGL